MTSPNFVEHVLALLYGDGVALAEKLLVERDFVVVRNIAALAGGDGNEVYLVLFEGIFPVDGMRNLSPR